MFGAAPLIVTEFYPLGIKIIKTDQKMLPYAKQGMPSLSFNTYDGIGI